MATKQQTHVNRVRLWCSSLGVLTAVSISRHEAEMKLAAFVPLLFDRFPDGAFTPASLEAVAARCVKGFPTYGELAAYLGEWWRANRPALPALPPPPPIRERAEPTPQEIEHVERVTRETVAALRSIAQPAERQAPGARHLSSGVLDHLNPMPNGWSRANAAITAPAGTPEFRDTAEAFDPDTWEPANDAPDDHPPAAA